MCWLHCLKLVQSSGLAHCIYRHWHSCLELFAALKLNNGYLKVYSDFFKTKSCFLNEGYKYIYCFVACLAYILVALFTFATG